MFEATSPLRFVYSVRIDLVCEFLEFGGQGVAWVTDLHWLTAGVGTAYLKKKKSSMLNLYLLLLLFDNLGLCLIF